MTQIYQNALSGLTISLHKFSKRVLTYDLEIKIQSYLYIYSRILTALQRRTDQGMAGAL